MYKNIKRISNTEADTSCHWIKKKLNILKKAITFKLIFKYMFPRKITTRLSMVIDKLMLKFAWKSKGPKLPKTILKNKNR